MGSIRHAASSGGCCPNLSVTPPSWRPLCRLEAGATTQIRTAPSGAAASRAWLALGAVFALLLTLVPAARAQTDASKPDSLGKQRTDLYLRATHTPLASLENDVNHIAVLSETCRIKFGSSACGLPDKALESDKLEERYEYYVKQPVEAHAKVHPAKIDRRNWAGSAAQH